MRREVNIRGVSISRGPKIFHLFFANDSLLFCKATMDECLAISEPLSCMNGHRDKIRILVRRPRFSV